MNDIALNLNTSLSSSVQVSPNFWTDPANGTPYYLAVQTPEYRVNSINALKNTPVTKFAVADSNPVPGLLSNVATLKRDSIATNQTRPTFSRSMRSMPTPTAATSVRSPPTSTRSWRNTSRN